VGFVFQKEEIRVFSNGLGFSILHFLEKFYSIFDFSDVNLSTNLILMQGLGEMGKYKRNKHYGRNIEHK